MRRPVDPPVTGSGSGSGTTFAERPATLKTWAGELAVPTFRLPPFRDTSGTPGLGFVTSVAPLEALSRSPARAIVELLAPRSWPFAEIAALARASSPPDNARLPPDPIENIPAPLLVASAWLPPVIDTNGSVEPVTLT